MNQCSIEYSSVPFFLDSALSFLDELLAAKEVHRPFSGLLNYLLIFFYQVNKTYLENSTIESEDDLQKLGEDLPEKQAILFADICQLESFSSADSEECEEAVDMRAR